MTNQLQVLEILEATRSRLGYPPHEILIPNNGEESDENIKVTFPTAQAPYSAEYQ